MTDRQLTLGFCVFASAGLLALGLLWVYERVEGWLSRPLPDFGEWRALD